MTPPARVATSPAAVRPAPGTDPDDHLTTGWEPHRPASDSLERRFVLAYASSLAGPTAAMGGRVLQRETHVTVDAGRPAGFLHNGIVLLQPLPHDGWQDVLGAAVRDLAPDGRGAVALWSPWPTPDLSPLGWSLTGHPPLMLRPHGGSEPPAPSWLRIERVRDARTCADWERVAVEGYPMDGCRPGAVLDERVLGDETWHGWVGYVEDRPVTIGTSYVAHGAHVLALGVTLPEQRGRGAWHAMAWRRLATFPDLPAMSLFSDFSRGPAEGLGFVALRRWTVWELDRP